MPLASEGQHGGPEQVTEDNLIILPLAGTCVGVKVGWKYWSVNSPLLRNLFMKVVTQRHIQARRHQGREEGTWTHISLICMEMYEGSACTFIHTHAVGWPSQDGI